MAALPHASRVVRQPIMHCCFGVCPCASCVNRVRKLDSEVLDALANVGERNATIATAKNKCFMILSILSNDNAKLFSHRY